MGRISDDEYLKTFNEEKHNILKAVKGLLRQPLFLAVLARNYVKTIKNLFNEGINQ